MRTQDITGLALIVFLVLASCSNSTDTGDQAQRFSGIYRTSDNGTFFGGDTTDWKLGDEGKESFTFGPAFPNPTSGECTIRLSLAVSGSVTVLLKKQGGATVNTVFDGVIRAGVYHLALARPDVPGIYRVEFTSSAGSSYGDIQFD